MSTVHENDRLFEGIDRVVERINLAVTQAGKLAVVVIFVDNMDRVCATDGHLLAGKAVREFHQRLDELARNGGLVVQLSDRKFALLLSEFRNEGHVRLAAQKVQRLIEKASRSNLEKTALQATMGITLVSGSCSDPQQILRFAEIAMLDGQRNDERVTFHHEENADDVAAEWNLEQKLANALEDGKLELHYQPKLELKSNRIVGAEALMRWHDPERGWIPPGKFIGVAERSGLITDLTYFCMQRACRQLSQWRDIADGFAVSVNTPPTSIRDREILDVLRIATSIWDVDPGSLVLEVTENALMVDPGTTHGILTAVREFGSRVSIDDFGTGYSSLAYLKEVPADELKIDRSFIQNMLSDPGDYKIVEHAASLAKIFGLGVVAEGVENQETLNVLWAMGCDYAQSFFICKPLPADEFLDWYRERDRRLNG